jgi:hypothetical protein
VEGQRSDRAVVVQIKSPEASILFPELNANLNFSGPDLARPHYTAASASMPAMDNEQTVGLDPLAQGANLRP